MTEKKPYTRAAAGISVESIGRSAEFNRPLWYPPRLTSPGTLSRRSSPKWPTPPAFPRPASAIWKPETPTLSPLTKLQTYYESKGVEFASDGWVRLKPQTKENAPW